MLASQPLVREPSRDNYAPSPLGVNNPIPHASAVFSVQRAAYLQDTYPSLAERKKHLRALREIVSSNRNALASAISEDFSGRSKDETMTLEIMQVLQLISYILPRLRSWMRPQRRKTGLLYFPAKARLHYQPLGVVGIISPWN